MTYQQAIIAVCVILVLAVGALCLVILYRRRSKDDLLDQLDKEQQENKELKEENEKLKALLANKGTSEDGNATADEAGVLFDRDDSTFSECLEGLSKNDRKFYEEMVKYTSSLTGTTLARSTKHERVNYGQKKPIAQFTIKKGRLIVKTNIGYVTIRQGEEDRKIEMKPISITIVDQNSFDEAKANIKNSYDMIAVASKKHN